MAYRPFAHLGQKLFAVVLAVLLWFAVARDPIVERVLRVPLQFQNIPEGIEILGEPLGSADVRARGASGIVSRLQPGDVTAVIDLGSSRPGLRLFHLDAGGVRAPFGVAIEQVAPATVAIELERTASRLVPVAPAIDGRPARGYVVGNVSSDPGTVEVVGPESRLMRLTDATTEPVAVTGATELLRDEVAIGVSDSSLRLAEPTTAVVTIDVLPAPVERTLAEVPVRIRNLSPSRSASLEPGVVSIGVGGTREATVALRGLSIDAYVDLTGLEPGRYDLPVRLAMPQEVGATGIEPPTVEVTVR